MSADLFNAISRFAAASRTPLDPQWNAELRDETLPDGEEGLASIQTALGWPAPQRISGRPRADQFPLLMFNPERGWKVALQWMGEEELALSGESEPARWDENQAMFALDIPDPLAADAPRAINIFTRAIGRRKHVLVTAGVATVFANILTLAISLYAMQLYDRVIPLASFETLFVLTAGVAFALILDFALRSLRAVLIEAEAQNIDREVSEFFFARAQAIRLDARPQGVGTMASQIQGQEQVRQVLSSSSLFVLADLPFALLFLAVIGWIGGAIAIIPLISLPIAIGLALLLARIIRSGAERAQVGGNQKNGVLVEMLDASETIKANSGGWHMLSRWNRLIRQVHHYEDPIKRTSAVSGSLFSALQQATYVAVMGYGAYLAATGQITTGGLLACSIIVGRINGPLVAQLPNLIVQWGYARSSLKALDSLLRLPLERSASAGALRPAAMRGSIKIDGVQFAYPDGEAVVNVASLDIKPGEKVALIGGVGAGKSTLLKLMAGLYTPQAGSIYLNGLDLGQIAEDVTRRHIGYLSQNARLVRGSLRDNLTMGLGDISDERLLEVARETSLDALLARQKSGMAVEIQEGGAGLSGGQRALVGLNRMIHAKPALWLLDEPTASLDAVSEQAAFKAIDNALQPEDILVMATHKIPLLEKFDRVLILTNGSIVKDTPAADLIKEMRGNGAAPARNGRPAPSTKSPGKDAGLVTTTLPTGKGK